MLFNAQFKRECQLAGLSVDDYIGCTFVGYGVICRDEEELTRAIRATSVPVGFELFPMGGWLLYAK